MSKSKRMNHGRIAKEPKKKNNGRTKPITGGLNWQGMKPKKMDEETAARYMREDSDRTLLPRFSHSISVFEK